VNKAFTVQPCGHQGAIGRALIAVGRKLKSFTERIAQARRRQQAYEQLAALSDPELEDLGIRRTDIPAVVSGRYRRAQPATSNVLTISPRKRPPSPG